jgi:Dockerin type I domain
MNSLDMYKNYEITPYDNRDWQNGVSTLDLVMIQRHVLGAEKLSSPYKMIAADVNNDQKISVTDLVSLRKIILGQESSVTDNTSWRFVPKVYNFPDPKNPWPFAENVLYDTLDNNQMSTDFYAIKIGDINGTVSNAQNTAASNRDLESKDLSIQDLNFAEGRYINVPISTVEEINVNALQMQMIIDKDVLDFRGIMAEGIALDEEDYYYNSNTGELRIVNLNRSNVNIKAGAVLFTLQFKAKAPEKLSRVLNALGKGNFFVNENVSQSELVLRYADDTEALIVNQNVPNPFEDYTDVKYFLAEKSKVEMTIYNASGLAIYNGILEGRAGENVQRIDGQQLGGNTGVFFLHIATGERREIKKLLRLN